MIPVKTNRLSISYFLFLFLCTTTGPTSTVRGGSETINTYTITISGDSIYGSIAPRSTIHIFSSTYSPIADTGLEYAALSDSNGNYKIGNLFQGTYNLLLFDSSKVRGAFHTHIMVGSTNSDTTITDSLSTVSSIHGTVMYVQDTIRTPLSRIQLFMDGSPFKTTTDTGGNYSFHTIPTQNYSFSLSFETVVSTIIDTSDVNRKLHNLQIGDGEEMHIDTVYIYFD